MAKRYRIKRNERYAVPRNPDARTTGLISNGHVLCPEGWMIPPKAGIYKGRPMVVDFNVLLNSAEMVRDSPKSRALAIGPRFIYGRDFSSGKPYRCTRLHQDDIGAVFINSEYLDLFITRHSDCVFYAKGRTDPVAVFRNGHVVGLIMPLDLAGMVGELREDNAA